jgi:preprotein translocase subunit SecB
MTDPTPHPAKVIEQYLSNVSLTRFKAVKLTQDVYPETTVAGDYALEENKDGTFLAKIQVDVHCVHAEEKLLQLHLQYEAIIDRGDLSDEEFNIFINLEYPPVVLTDARKLISDLTAETGVLRITIDPWDFVRQFLTRIASAATDNTDG